MLECGPRSNQRLAERWRGQSSNRVVLEDEPGRLDPSWSGRYHPLLQSAAVAHVGSVALEQNELPVGKSSASPRYLPD
jgi:hypothetical protein